MITQNVEELNGFIGFSTDKIHSNVYLTYGFSYKEKPIPN